MSAKTIDRFGTRSKLGSKNSSLILSNYDIDKESALSPPTPLQVVLRRRNQPNSQYYLTHGSEKYLKDCGKEDLQSKPYRCPKLPHNDDYKDYCKILSKQIRTEERKLGFKDGHNYRTRQFQSNLRARIYVPEPPNEVRTILDIDPEFYSIIKGRPVKYTFSESDYMRDVKGCTSLNLQTGYQADEELRINENFNDEEAIFQNICKKYNEYVDSFEKFLAEDYESSMSMLRESQEMSASLDEKNTEYKTISEELGALKRKVSILEERCRYAKMYQDFLYKVSPFSWCEDNSVGVFSKLKKIDLSEEESGEIFSKYKMDAFAGTTVSLDSLIGEFNEEFKNMAEPKLYFTEPWQMIKMLHNIVMQNLRSWTNSEKLAENLEMLENKIKVTEKLMNQEYEDMEGIIADLSVAIESEEKRAVALKDKAVKVIKKSFHGTLASDSALKIHVSVKNVYENLISKMISFSTFEMMKALELDYESNMKKLDHINLAAVKSAQKECYSNDIKMMKTANDASKKLRNLQKLNKRLKKALLPKIPKKDLNVCATKDAHISH